MNGEAYRRVGKPALLAAVVLAFLMCMAFGSTQAAYAAEPLVLNVNEMDLDQSDYEGSTHVVYAKSGYINDVVSLSKSVAKVWYNGTQGQYVVVPVAPGETKLKVTNDVAAQTTLVSVRVTEAAVEGYKDYCKSLLKTGHCVAKAGSTEAEYYFDRDLYEVEMNDEWFGGDIVWKDTAYIGEFGFADTGNYYFIGFWNLPVLKPGDVLNYTVSYDGIEYGTTYTIKKRDLKTDISDWLIELTVKKQVTCNGKKQVPVKLYDYETGRTMKAGTDYTVKATNNKSVGKAKVVITGKGIFTGSVTEYFKIVPKGTSIKGFKAGKKKFTVTWKKRTTQTTGYQIRYSTKKSMSNAKKKLITSNKTTKKTIKSLKKKKTYYVQVRTYKKVKGVKYWSKWSAKRTVKTK